MTRLLIVGLDGLDPILVDRWRLDWLKQVFWGKYYVKLFKTMYTPIIWASMLTGVNVEEYGFNISVFEHERVKRLYGNPLLRVLYELRKRFLPHRSLGFRRLVVRLGLESRKSSVSVPHMPQSLLDMSVFSVLEGEGFRVAAIEVPGLNEELNEYYRSRVSSIIEKGRPVGEARALVSEALLETLRRVRIAAGFVREEYDLVFVYSPLPDIAFHLFPFPRLRERAYLRSVHVRLQGIVRPLVDYAVSRGYVVLIVSDHGFDLEKYDHSEYGFWSLSRRFDWWKISSVLDFKDMILRIVRE